MRIASHKRARSGGIAVLLTSVMIVGAMMAVGLAVDVGMMYAVKTKLSAAADAAALGGARALGRAGSGGPTGQAAATAYFNANMTTGYMMSTNISSTVTGPTVNGSIQTMTVNAQADLPLLFTRFIQNTQTIKVSASASRQDVNLVMVLDRSSSMNASGSCVPMVAAAQDFTNQFEDGRDNLGLIVFGGSYDKAYNLSTTFKSGGATINSVIGTITCGGNTGSAQAIWQAYQMLVALNQPGALNVIVFFTDGQPNGLSADWPIATAATPVYPLSSGSNIASTSATPTSPWFLGYAKSGCTSTTTLTGVIARSNEVQHGIFGMVTASIGSDAGTIAVAGANGCAFESATKDAFGQNLQDRVREDVAYIPALDTYGNKTTGYWDSVAANGSHGAAQKLLIPAGPYVGQPMLDHYDTGNCGLNPCGLFNNNIDIASMNAAEDAALRARSNGALPVVIFCIGLGGAADVFPGDFLKHVANTQDSDRYNVNQPSGKYIFVTGKGQLGSAFQQVASFVQRLSS
jgi:Mg-chelatase subunit ChlD